MIPLCIYAALVHWFINTLTYFMLCRGLKFVEQNLKISAPEFALERFGDSLVMLLEADKTLPQGFQRVKIVRGESFPLWWRPKAVFFRVPKS